jgi:hypothetical protein
VGSGLPIKFSRAKERFGVMDDAGDKVILATVQREKIGKFFMIVDDNERPIEQTITEVFEAFFESISFLDLRGVRANGGEGVIRDIEPMKVEFWCRSIDQPLLPPSTMTSIGIKESLERWPKGMG